MNKLLFLFILSLSISCAAKNIRVMVIDTGTDLSHEEIKSHVREKTDFNYIDENGHGTAMASLVLKDTCESIELISCRYYSPLVNHMDASNACFKRALNENIDYINFSSSGNYEEPTEKKLLKQLSDKGVIIVLAAGNDSINLTKNGKCEGSFPACYLYKNMYIVQNVDRNGNLNPGSNYLKAKNARSEMGVNVPVLLPNKQYGTISGTSPATARFMNSLLLKKCWEMSK